MAYRAYRQVGRLPGADLVEARLGPAICIVYTQYIKYIDVEIYRVDGWMDGWMDGWKYYDRFTRGFVLYF